MPVIKELGKQLIKIYRGEGRRHSELKGKGFGNDKTFGRWFSTKKETAEDFVIATGQTWTVKQFAEFAFNEIGINIIWQGQGIDEVGLDAKTGEVLVKVNPRFFRPTEVELLLGNPSKAEEVLGWKRKVCFKELVKEMISFEIK